MLCVIPQCRNTFIILSAPFIPYDDVEQKHIHDTCRWIESGEPIFRVQKPDVPNKHSVCDLVVAWTYLSGKARETFIAEMDMDADTWLRARAWALWKATFELCQIADKNSADADGQRRIIDEVVQ